MGYERREGILGKILMWLFVIVILALVFMFLFNLTKAGYAKELKEKIGVTLENSKILKPFSSFLNLVKKTTTPEGILEIEKSYEWKATIDENSINKNLGLKFTSFNPERTSYSTKDFDKVIVRGRGEIETIGQDVNVEFLCLTGDKDKNGIVTLGGLSGEGGPTRFLEGRKTFFNVKCEYDKDLFEINTNILRDTQTITLQATYDFATQGYVYVYLLRSDIIEERRDKGEYILKDIENPKIKSDGRSKIVVTDGPIDLKLQIDSTQPISEIGPYGEESAYELTIMIDNKESWNGNIKEVEELYIYMPKETRLINKDFDYIEEEEGLDKYKASQEFIEKTNNICKEDEECWSKGVEIWDINFIVEPIEKEETQETYIIVKGSFKYQDKIKSTVSFENV